MTKDTRQLPRAEAGALRSIRDIARDEWAFIVCSLQRFGVPPADIDDVAQEVLLAVCRALSRYDRRRGKLRTWLFKIAFYQSQNYNCRAYHRREVLLSPSYFEESLVDLTPSADLLTIHREEEQIVCALLGAINANARDLFIAYEIDGLAMREIADNLGIPKSTAWSRLTRARTEFLQALKRWRHCQARLMRCRRHALR